MLGNSTKHLEISLETRQKDISIADYRRVGSWPGCARIKFISDVKKHLQAEGIGIR